MSGKRSKARRRRRRARRFVLRFLFFAAVLAALAFVFQLKTVVVRGNLHETPEEITEMILSRPVFGNTLLAKAFNTNRRIESDGFVEKLDVRILSPDTIRVYVTERNFVGCLTSGGRWWYFDSAGAVRASALSRTDGEQIPPVEGLELGSDPAVGKGLPITNTKVFSMLGVLSNLVSADSTLMPDMVTFDGKSSMTLTYGDITVLLGTGEKLELRIRKMGEVLPAIEGKYKGTLHLETYDGSQSNLIFDPSGS